MRDADPGPLAERIAARLRAEIAEANARRRAEAAASGGEPPEDVAEPHDLDARALREARAELRSRWDRACAAYVEENLGLAIRFARLLNARHVPEQDVVHAAAVGLLRAIQEFNPALAGKFSSFAVWKMRHETNTIIRRQEGPIVPPPGQLLEDRRAVDEAQRVLSAALGRPPEDAEVLTHLREKENRDAQEAIDRGEEPRDPRWANQSEERVRDVREAHVGVAHKALDPRRGAPDAGVSPETRIHVRRAFARLDPLLRAALADDLDIDLPGAEEARLPECPVARAQLLELARQRLRRLLEA